MATDLEIAQLIGTRLCHDLAGPVGAISAGVELIGDDPDMVDAESLNLIAGSAGAANDKLRFLRMAFGSTGSGGASLERLQESVTAYLSAVAGQSGSIGVTWFGDEDYTVIGDRFGDAAAQLIANVILLALEAAPGAQHLTCRGPGDGGFVSVESVGAQDRTLRLRQDLLDVVSGMTADPLSARTVQAFFAKRLAQGAGGLLKAEPVERGLVAAICLAD